ncbi:hypothetical protein niasHT_028832 [Heterodera trifolii]|uniref:Uncharacterized protein n=1 Tax=Heterodera trifolii TaxID=157864 RepID=A0ABD2KRD6_9BILA
MAVTEKMAALRWADEKCRKNAIECSAANRRAALGPALFKIRFPLITLKTFAKEIVPFGILTLEGVISVYQYHSHPDHLCGVPELYPMKFPCHGRISDWNIAKGNRGTLAMEIEKLSEFAGFESFITFAELMDPSKGLYDREADKVKLAIDFSVEEVNSEES